MMKSLRDSSMRLRRPAQPKTHMPTNLARLMRCMEGPRRVTDSFARCGNRQHGLQRKHDGHNDRYAWP